MYPGADITKTRKGETTKVFNTAALNQNIGIPRYAPMAGGFRFECRLERADGTG
jgi:hypothetical protein